MRGADLPPFFDYLGLSVLAVSTDEVSVRMTVPAALYSPFGTVHGGAIAALIDTTIGIAVAAHLGPHDRNVTHELNLNYISFAKGPTVLCRARVLRLGRHVASVEAEAVTEEGALVAKALGTFGLLRKRGAEERDS